MILDFFGPYGKEAPGMFSKDHFILLSIFIPLIILGIIIFRKANKRQVRIITIIFAGIITLLEILKIAYHYRENNLAGLSSWLPIHYCSLFIYALWFASSKHERIKKLGAIFISSGGTIAGICYLTYPTTSLSYVGMDHFLTIHAFIFHSSMLFMGLLYLIANYYRPEFKDFIYYFIFFTFFAIIATILNYTRNENLMMMREAYMLPKILMVIANYSKPLYTLCVYFGYIFIFFVPTTIIYFINMNKKDQS